MKTSLKFRWLIPIDGYCLFCIVVQVQGKIGWRMSNAEGECGFKGTCLRSVFSAGTLPVPSMLRQLFKVISAWRLTAPKLAVIGEIIQSIAMPCKSVSKINPGLHDNSQHRHADLPSKAFAMATSSNTGEDVYDI